MVANQTILDATLRHEVFLRRYATSEVRSILALLERADADLVEKLRRRLADGRSTSLATKRMQNLLKAVEDLRKETMRELAIRARTDLTDLAKVEAAAHVAVLQHALPIELDLITPPVPVLRAAVTSQPFATGSNGARTLAQWFEDLQAADLRRVTGAVQLGVVQGEPIDAIVRRIVGTRANKFADGILSVSRRNAEAIVRTAVNHVSNAAREAVGMANADIVQGFRVVATLDGRTSQYLHGARWEGRDAGRPQAPRGSRGRPRRRARPPYHANCRTALTPFVSADGVAARAGERPYVMDVRTRRRATSISANKRETPPAISGSAWIAARGTHTFGAFVRSGQTMPSAACPQRRPIRRGSSSSLLNSRAKCWGRRARSCSGAVGSSSTSSSIGRGRRSRSTSWPSSDRMLSPRRGWTPRGSNHTSKTRKPLWRF